MSNEALFREKVETLNGDRRNARARAAVRVEDLSQLLRIPAKLQSTQVVGAPTEAEHNALQADVAAMHAQISLVIAALQARLR